MPALPAWDGTGEVFEVWIDADFDSYTDEMEKEHMSNLCVALQLDTSDCVPLGRYRGSVKSPFKLGQDNDREGSSGNGRRERERSAAAALQGMSARD